MICHRCLLTRTSFPARLYSTAKKPAVATSTSAAQPFSTPFTPSPYRASSRTHPSKSNPSKGEALPPSMLPAGTPLRGLAFEKNKDPPVAREDNEYPDWLWGLIEKNDGGGEGKSGTSGGDAFSKSAKQRRIASRITRQGGPSVPSLEDTGVAPVPIHEQSVDLPAATGAWRGRDVDLRMGRVAREKREELTGSLRGERRRAIKEGNFLKGMR
ncbi:MAG: hypothetical protein L6R40_006027 [Gallowayella cf. fulva]|nr:MAG: hypothetical protein L6R40_006027 [Xanthomendoza cf. fulva]